MGALFLPSMPENPPVIAIVDDEPRMRAALSRLLRARGYGVVSFEDGAALFDAPNIQAFGCILLDLHMPGINGFAVLETLAGRATHPPVIVITGHDQPGNAERLERLGARAYLTKPVDEVPLLHAIKTVLGSPSAAVRAPHST
jgi:FixJ family two-component response regulator